jgi:hypothetical protein
MDGVLADADIQAGAQRGHLPVAMAKTELVDQVLGLRLG